MREPSDAGRQRERDERQVSQHYVHWGVKTIVGLVAGAAGGLLWLAWVVFIK
jgi:hypothetical protein